MFVGPIAPQTKQRFPKTYEPYDQTIKVNKKNPIIDLEKEEKHVVKCYVQFGKNHRCNPQAFDSGLIFISILISLAKESQCSMEPIKAEMKNAIKGRRKRKEESK